MRSAQRLDRLDGIRLYPVSDGAEGNVNEELEHGLLLETQKRHRDRRRITSKSLPRGDHQGQACTECGDPGGAHRHYRCGTDCGRCACPRFNRAGAADSGSIRWGLVNAAIALGVTLAAAALGVALYAHR
jgi:hypothetical protein